MLFHAGHAGARRKGVLDVELILAASIVAWWGEMLPAPLETPPFDYELSESVEVIPSLVLSKSSPNSTTDYYSWFADKYDWPSITFHNGGVNDATRAEGPVPDGIDRILHTPGGGEFHLYQIIVCEEAVLAVYGSPPNRFGVVLDPRMLVVLDPVNGRVLHVLDFLTYCEGPACQGLDEDVVFQQIRWAWVEDGILYVSNAHRTYAESSRGRNAYITAIDLSTYRRLWRSSPLVSNSENFVVTGDAIITGYGFTDEDDFVYVLDRRTGEVVQQVEVPSAPEYFYLEGDELEVRCVGADLFFTLL